MRTLYPATFTLLFAVPAYAAEIHQLPRSHLDAEVRAQVECLDPDGCDVAELCLTPDEWASDEPTGYVHLATPARGELAWTSWTADPGLACAVRVGGVANVVAEKGHVGRNSLETADVHRIRSAVGELEDLDVPLAAGPGADCRPATHHNYCPDAVHLPDASCPEGEPAWHVYVEDVHDNHDAHPVYAPRPEVEEGTVVRFRSNAAYWPTPGTHGTYHWRVAHGNWHDDTWSNMPPNQSIAWRAPWVSADAVETITLTLAYRGHCSTTTFRIKVLNGE